MIGMINTLSDGLFQRKSIEITVTATKIIALINVLFDKNDTPLSRRIVFAASFGEPSDRHICSSLFPSDTPSRNISSMSETISFNSLFVTKKERRARSFLIYSFCVIMILPF